MGSETRDDRIRRLRAVSLFADLSDDSLDRVLDLVSEFEAHHGHVLAQPGQPGAGLFVLLEGRVRVELPGRELELGPGEFFGELALLDEGAVHTGRVTSMTDVKCLAIRRDDFDQLLVSEPGMALGMLKVLARRLAASVRS
jgi:CRP/FNR family cyclic AMP-dependent transcriptional regulator